MFRKEQREKLIGFFKKNGFYLVMAVCILGIGLGAFFGLGVQSEQTEEPSASPAAEESAEQVQAIVTPKPTLPQNTPLPSVTPSATAAAKNQTARVMLEKPLDGEITKAFSGDTLVYNPTLNMWMTHNGIDITASTDTAIKAALAGEVSAVRNDDSWGIVVEIDHGSNGRTVYAGLSEACVAVGDKINAGMQLGNAGTPPCEAAQGVHLHFEYVVKEAYRDPAEQMRA